jgi:hypothetical protein
MAIFFPTSAVSVTNAYITYDSSTFPSLLPWVQLMGALFNTVSTLGTGMSGRGPP